MNRMLHTPFTPLSHTLIETHLPLVSRLARKYRSSQVYADCLSAGNAALVEAARHYDRQKGPFEPYARIWILAAMSHELHRVSYSVTVPERVVLLANRERRYRYDYFRDHGQYPTRAQCEQALNITPRMHDALQRASVVIKSLDSLNADTEDALSDASLDASTYDTGFSPLLDAIGQSIQSLDPLARAIFVLRAGLLTGQMESFSAIALLLPRWGFRVSSKKVERLWYQTLSLIKSSRYFTTAETVYFS